MHVYAPCTGVARIVCDSSATRATARRAAAARARPPREAVAAYNSALAGPWRPQAKAAALTRCDRACLNRVYAEHSCAPRAAAAAAGVWGC
jgi:hypothetical protein